MKNLTEVFRRVIQPTTSMKVTITYIADGRLSLVGSGRHGSGQVYHGFSIRHPIVDGNKVVQYPYSEEV